MVPSAEPAPRPDGSARAVPQPSAQPGEPEAPAAADCTVAPEREYVAVGPSHPCFTVMGERLLVWLGGAAHPVGGSYEAVGGVSKAADGAKVRAVQLLMDDVRDGWLGATPVEPAGAVDGREKVRSLVAVMRPVVSTL
jgi:hypothetical protein